MCVSWSVETSIVYLHKVTFPIGSTGINDNIMLEFTLNSVSSKIQHIEKTKATHFTLTYKTCFMLICTNVNFFFFRLHINKTNAFCFLIDNGRVTGTTSNLKHDLNMTARNTPIPLYIVLRPKPNVSFMKIRI